MGLLNLFKSKNKQNTLFKRFSADAFFHLPEQLSPLAGGIEVIEQFPRLNWPNISEALQKDSSYSTIPNLFDQLSKFWLARLANALTSEYRIVESEHFILLSPQPDKQVNLFLKFLEGAHKRIQHSLKGIVDNERPAKLVVLEFDSIDSYYAYIAYHYPVEGEFAASGGVFIRQGLGHFAIPHYELSVTESVAAHELTHALLSHLELPVWVDEGLAVNVERMITRHSPFQMNQQKHQKHLQFWNEETIQTFWSGESFSIPGDSNELSYQLAQLIVQSLAEDHEGLIRFVNSASFSDGGEGAAQKVYGGSLAAIIDQFFGPGEWRPLPDSWTN